MLKSPGILLSVDDSDYIDGWHDLLPWLHEREMRATFYLTGFDFDDETWRKIEDMRDAGHCIGHHGYQHSRAGLVGKRLDRSNPRLADEIAWQDWDEFVRGEIEPGRAALLDHGIAAKHYSYPFGNHTDESDDMLLGIFKTLRIGGRGTYPCGAVPPVFGAYSLEAKAHNEGLAKVRSGGKVVSFLIHEPDVSQLECLHSAAGVRDLRYYTADDVGGAS